MDKDRYIRELQNALTASKRGARYAEICTNYATRLLNSNLPVIFDKRHLAGLLGMDLPDLTALLYIDDKSLYTIKNIPKKSGGNREIAMPCVLLKYIQRWILDNILSHIPVSKYATGFQKGSSILRNAEIHTDQECIINVDIKDFFPTITIDDVFHIFYYYGYTKEMAYTFSKICTYNGILPQGSPASPYISNICCLKLDKRLSLLADSIHAKYTRYADDITFSGPQSIVSILPCVMSVIADEGFAVNENKTRVAFRHQRQEVTGLIVNGHDVRVSKKYKQILRQEIYYCKKYGPYEHQKYTGDSHTFLKEHLYGKAYFVAMVEPEIGEKMLSALDEVNWDY